MPYIGKSPVGGGFHKLDNLTASATATYALTLSSAAYFPETANQLLVSLNGVIQAPQDSFTVSGSNLIFDSALTASDSIDFVVALGDVLGVGSVTDGAVTTNKIANQSVTMAKLATSGTLPALDGSNLTGVGVAGISSSSTSGTALSIDANNIVTTPSKPMMSVRGQSTSASNSAVFATFVEITGWASTSVNVGNCLQNGRFRAPLTGIYSLSGFSHRGAATNYRYFGMYHYDGSTYTAVASNYAANDYDEYTIGSSLLYPMTAGDEILLGWDSNYTSWLAGEQRSSFTGYLVS